MKKMSQATVAYACNPNYSRGRDQEDYSSKLTQAKKKKERKKGN
jgi:hypothetical protein